MTSRSKKITERQCKTWFYAPQVSEKNIAYALGQVENKWGKLMTDCSKYFKDHFGDFYEPGEIIAFIRKINREEGYTVENMINFINNGIASAENEEQIRVYLAAFILAYGLILQEEYARATNPFDIVSTKNYIFLFYRNAYEKALERVENTDYLVTPTQLITLYSADFKDRPPNPLLTGDASTSLKESVSAKPHPITKAMQKCALRLSTECENKFKKINNWAFTPLAKVLGCYCTFFKQRLIKSSGTSVTFNSKYYDNITTGDYTTIQNRWGDLSANKKPSIMIEKYRESNNTCENRTYLSQLFSKVCPPLYEPFIAKAQDDTLMGLGKANGIMVDAIRYYRCSAYFNGYLNVFHTGIMGPYGLADKANIAVQFLTKEGAVEFDEYSGPTRQFFSSVVQELLIHEILVSEPTYFNNQRYRLNVNLDIEKLPCYAKLAPALKTKENKEAITLYFYEFIGYLLRFAVVNNLELGCKLSRVYIAQLFNIYDFSSRAIYSDLELQYILISFYLLERPNSYTDMILKIMEHPRVLIGESPKEEAGLADMIKIVFAPGNDDNDNVIKMNDLYTIVPEDENRPIYSDNEETLFLNFTEYLFKTALKYYSGNDMDMDKPVTPSYVQHPHLAATFRGFNAFHNFNTTTFSKFKDASMVMSSLTDVQKLAAVRKLDVYLSGFGITYETIRDVLLERLSLYPFETNVYPEYARMMNAPNSRFIPESLDEEDHFITNVYYEKVFYWFYRILLNRGKNISEKFIQEYNNKFFKIPFDQPIRLVDSMTKEDYHNEFVKFLLKVWSGVGAIDTVKRYSIKVIEVASNLLPNTHTCFLIMDLFKQYTSARELYNDLVQLIISTNFGESLSGGRKKVNKKKHHKYM